jgi:hypothetical protein
MNKTFEIIDKVIVIHLFVHSRLHCADRPRVFISHYFIVSPDHGELAVAMTGYVLSTDR